MNKEEAIEQSQRLTLDWQENGLDTKLNQTDINAIGIIVLELDKANNKIEKIKGIIKTMYNSSRTLEELLLCDYLLSMIDGS